MRERIQFIDEQTKCLKEEERNQAEFTNKLINSNELSLLSDELTSYDDSNDNLILNNILFEDEEEINNSQLNEKDREIELQMLDIKRILNAVELNKRKTRFVMSNSVVGQFSEQVKMCFFLI